VRFLREAYSRHLGVMGMPMWKCVGREISLMHQKTIRLGATISVEVPDRH
jgi:hypothetical protein